MPYVAFVVLALAGGLALMLQLMLRRRHAQRAIVPPASARVEDLAAWGFAQAQADALEHHRRTLDGSDDSVRLVEEILARLAGQATDAAGAPRPGVRGMALIYGMYIGEVIRRRHGGVWGTDHPDAGPGSYPIRHGTSTSFPVSWAFNRLVAGAADDVWFKFHQMTRAGGVVADGGPVTAAAEPVEALAGLPAGLRESFVLVRGGDGVPYDFWIAVMPLLEDAGSGLPQLGRAGGTGALACVTWTEAVQACDRLSLAHHLPVAHDPASGRVVAEGGFRLPTPREWECAARGWSGAQRDGGDLALHRRLFKDPARDGPLTPAQLRARVSGHAQAAELAANSLGIRGLLGLAREWAGGAPGLHLQWEEYCLNYDNDSGHRVTQETGADGRRLPFRVVLRCRVSTAG